MDSVSTVEEAHRQTAGMDSILEKGGFKVKGWLIGGLSIPDPSEDLESVAVLGVWWHPTEDFLHFKVRLNFSPKRRGIRTGPDITIRELRDITPDLLTRRRLLEQVMGLFDPLGLLSPFLLKAKVYLRETLVEKLGWDDSISSTMASKWIEFFTHLFSLENLKFPRCLTPTTAVGNPGLVILSDGFEVAYGCAAYIR